MSSAIKAIAHVLRRVQIDPDLAWHMVGTESLALCMQAFAEHKQRDPEEFREEIERAIAAMQQVKKSRVLEQQETINCLRNAINSHVCEDSDDDFDDDEEKLLRLEMMQQELAFSRVGELLDYCRIRNERPTIEAVEAALDRKSLAYCLQQLEYVA